MAQQYVIYDGNEPKSVIADGVAAHEAAESYVVSTGRVAEVRKVSDAKARRIKRNLVAKLN